MSDRVYVCPACNGTQHTPKKCLQCGAKVLSEEDYFERRENAENNGS